MICCEVCGINLVSEYVSVDEFLFPANLGYCKKCYPNSYLYKEKMQLLNCILDRIDSYTKSLLVNFIHDFEEDHIQLYINEINKQIILKDGR